MGFSINTPTSTLGYSCLCLRRHKWKCFKRSCFSLELCCKISLTFHTTCQQTTRKSSILNSETNDHGCSHLFVVKILCCVKKMKYDQTSIADVCSEADKAATCKSFYRNNSKMQRRGESTLSHDSPASKPHCVWTVTPTDQCTATVWAGIKGSGIEASNFCIPRWLYPRRRNWGRCILWNEVNQLQTCQTDKTKTGMAGRAEPRACVQQPSGWFSAIPQKYTKYQRRLPLKSTYRQSQTSCGTVEVNTSTDLSLLSTPLCVLHSPREVTPKRIFCSYFGLNELRLKCWGAFIYGTKVNLRALC